MRTSDPSGHPVVGQLPAGDRRRGGGTWFISSHSKNLAAADKFVQFVTTDDAYQVNLAPGYPAYAAAGAKWIAKQESRRSVSPCLQAHNHGPALSETERPPAPDSAFRRSTRWAR